MNITISDKLKKQLFVNIFQMMKQFTNQINIICNKAGFHIQSCDINNVILFELYLSSNWFNNYNVNENINICINLALFYKILNTLSDQDLIIEYSVNKSDILHIYLENIGNSKNFQRHYQITLIEYSNYDEFQITENDYELDIKIGSKPITDLLLQMQNFGDDTSDLMVQVNEEDILFIIESVVSGKLIATINANDIIEHAVIENLNMNVLYSMKYIKSCITKMLTEEVSISISQNFPMKISYDLGEDSYFMYYLPPKEKSD